MLSFLFSLLLFSTVLAQQLNSPSTVVVTTTAAAGHVRFAAPSSVVQIRVEVYDAAGVKVFDNEVRGGNVLDWHLQDGQAQHISDGSYVCVVTVKSSSGRINQKLGTTTVLNAVASVEPTDGARMTRQQSEAVGPIEENAALTVLKEGETQTPTVIAHNGTDGQVVRGRGALSFRLGDFYSGKDVEQMRLTEEGNLGIGTDSPQAKLDVAGVIRTSKGIEFGNQTDGGNGSKVTMLTTTATGALQTTMADGTVVSNATGSGTQDKIAKWTDSAGTLGDSAITETSGNVGIGTAIPTNKLDVVRGTAGQMAKGFFEMSSFEYDADAKFGVYSSASSAPSAALTFGATRLQVNGRFPGFELQYIYGPTAAQNQARFNYIERSANGAVANFAANLLTINGNGNVTLNPITSGVSAAPRLGIGTTSPSAMLDVAGNINTSTQYDIGGLPALRAPISNIYGGDGAGGTGGSSNAAFGVVAGNHNTGMQNSFFGRAAGFSNNSGENNVFVGISAGSANTSGSRNTFVGGFADASTNNLSNATAIGWGAGVSQSDSLVLGNGVNVGIGTGAPLGRLQVVTANDTNPSIITAWDARHFVVGATANSGGIGLSYDQTNNVGYIEALTPNVAVRNLVLQASGGSVGIATIPEVANNDSLYIANDGGNTANSLRVDGFQNSLYLIARSGPGSPAGTNIVFRTALPGAGEADHMTLDQFGNLTVTGNVCATNISCTSDARLKKNIKHLPYGLHEVMMLRPVTWQWKEKSNGQLNLGMLAQEVAPVLPELVLHGADVSQPLGLNYMGLIPVLVKAEQEQEGQILEQQQQLRQKNGRIEKLETRLAALETVIENRSVRRMPRRHP
jgi:hypothetical protein